MVNRRAWEKRQQQWERFNQWEATAPEAHEVADLQAVLSWFSDVWELAASFHPGWRAGSLDMEKARHLEHLRQAFSKINSPKFSNREGGDKSKVQK